MTIITNIGNNYYSNNYYSPETIYTGGELVSIFLIISLIIAFLVADTKYWNRQIADTLGAYSNPLLLVFIAIVIFKIVIIIYK